MNIRQLQQAIGTTDDGIWGQKSRAALIAHFTNRQAPALTEADLQGAAQALGTGVAQIRAVRVVEAAGTGFDRNGLPKILFERHLFHRLTGGRFSPAVFSQPSPGGYDVDSWTKLGASIATGEVDAAFMSASWGLFQVLGKWWSELGYASPFEMALSATTGEAAQLAMFERFVLRFGLADELRALSGDPAACRAFAAAYNGPGYRTNRYDEKLAAEMRR